MVMHKSELTTVLYKSAKLKYSTKRIENNNTNLVCALLISATKQTNRQWRCRPELCTSFFLATVTERILPTFRNVWAQQKTEKLNCPFVCYVPIFTVVRRVQSL